MAPSVRRRLTPVAQARELLAAIIYIREQRQIPNFERISKYLQRYSEITPRRCKEVLNNAVSDGFIVEYNAMGNRGQRTGVEQEGYRIPKKGEVEDQNDGHDWYCFECHKPGEVFECSGCFRVYHQGCTREDTTGPTFICSVCRDKEARHATASKKKNKMKKKMLNTLLSYTIVRLREKTRELHKISQRAPGDDFKRYVFRKMDLNRMEQKVQASRYKCLEEFHADARTILHNCFLIFGDAKGGMTDLAQVMVKDCKYDIDEIELCPNCYYMSNAKPDDWFAKPCNPPHELVFARQKGYCYWPAKVVQDLGGKMDVRFFGGWHQRAVLPAESIKPIATELSKMGIKKSAGFNKAMQELKRHQNLLEERAKELAESATNEDEEEEEEDEEEGEEEDFFKEEEEPETEDPEEPVEDELENEIRDEEELEEEEEPLEKRRASKGSKVAIKRKSLSSLNRSKSKTPKYKKSKSAKSPKLKLSPFKRRKLDVDNKEKDEVEETVEDDIEMREVTSTSVEKSRKHRNIWKYASSEELHTVTSSGDGVAASPVPTTQASVQTPAKTLEDSFMQTEPCSEAGLGESEALAALRAREVEASQMEDRMAQGIEEAMQQLTQRLEEKFEEDKKQALAQLSQRLEEDFGKDKKEAVERTIASMKKDVETARKAGEEAARDTYMAEMKKLAAKHKEAISLTKKKQWCQSCEDEAIYHCCWNTSYCSTKCQQVHWQKEHKRVCRRKRPDNH